MKRKRRKVEEKNDDKSEGERKVNEKEGREGKKRGHKR